MKQRKPLGQILCEKYYITEAQVEQARQQQIEEYELLGQILVSLGHISEEDLFAVAGDSARSVSVRE